MADEADTDVLRLTAKIISAHVGNNQVTVAALPELIQSVRHYVAATPHRNAIPEALSTSSIPDAAFHGNKALGVAAT